MKRSLMFLFAFVLGAQGCTSQSSDTKPVSPVVARAQAPDSKPAPAIPASPGAPTEAEKKADEKIATKQLSDQMLSAFKEMKICFTDINKGGFGRSPNHYYVELDCTHRRGTSHPNNYTVPEYEEFYKTFLNIQKKSAELMLRSDVTADQLDAARAISQAVTGIVKSSEDYVNWLHEIFSPYQKFAQSLHCTFDPGGDETYAIQCDPQSRAADLGSALDEVLHPAKVTEAERPLRLGVGVRFPSIYQILSKYLNLHDVDNTSQVAWTEDLTQNSAIYAYNLSVVKRVFGDGPPINANLSSDNIPSFNDFAELVRSGKFQSEIEKIRFPDTFVILSFADTYVTHYKTTTSVKRSQYNGKEIKYVTLNVSVRDMVKSVDLIKQEVPKAIDTYNQLVKLESQFDALREQLGIAKPGNDSFLGIENFNNTTYYRAMNLEEMQKMIEMLNSFLEFASKDENKEFVKYIDQYQVGQYIGWDKNGREFRMAYDSKMEDIVRILKAYRNGRTTN